MFGYGEGGYGEGTFGGYIEYQGAGLAVELAFGADLLADASTWDWVNITDQVRQDPGISTFVGRNDESSSSNPASCSFVVDNSSGDFSLGGASQYYPNVKRNTPVRIRAGEGMKTVFQGYADGFTPSWDGNKVPVVTISASGTLRRLSQGSTPLKSSFYRSMEAEETVVAYWPLEVGNNPTVVPAVRGGSDFSFTGDIDWAANDDFACSEPLPELTAGTLKADVFAYEDTGENQLRFLLKLPEGLLPDATVLARVYTSGKLNRWDLTFEDGGDGDGFGLRGYDVDGAVNFYQAANFDPADRVCRFNFSFSQNGSNIDWTIGTVELGDEIGSFVSGTVTGRTAGIITRIELGPNADLDGTIFGHVTIQNEVTDFFDSTYPLNAYVGQIPSQRFQMVCADNDIPIEVNGTADVTELFDRLGPIPIATLPDVLQEIETADYGQLWDGLDAGLGYTTRRRKSAGEVVFSIAASDLAAGFQPVDDDQRTRNKVTAKRIGGISRTFEDTDGPLGTAAIGVYDDSVEINKQYDDGVLDYASWAVNLGTVEGYRYPSVSFWADDVVLADALAVKPGFRIQVTGVLDVFPSLPSDTVDLIVEGIGHEMTSGGWLITYRCSSFDPWGVSRVSDESGDTSEFVARVNTDGSTLTAGYSAGSTSISVATPSGPLWTTDSDDYPLELSVGGVRVTATACSGASSPQTFTVDPLPAAMPSGAAVKLWRVWSLDL